MSQKLCTRCQSTIFRRINRRGWLERVMLSKLGMFPWECVHCRRRKFFRDQGHTARPRRLAAPQAVSVFDEPVVGKDQPLG